MRRFGFGVIVGAGVASAGWMTLAWAVGRGFERDVGKAVTAAIMEQKARDLANNEAWNPPWKPAPGSFRPVDPQPGWWS